MVTTREDGTFAGCSNADKGTSKFDMLRVISGFHGAGAIHDHVCRGIEQAHDVWHTDGYVCRLQTEALNLQAEIQPR